jgi:hypothetical protein
LLPVALNRGASEIKSVTNEAPEWITTPARVFLENIPPFLSS